MNINKKSRIAIAALVLVSAFHPTAYAKSSIEKLVQDQITTSQMIIGQTMPGGWSEIATDDPDVKKAAEKAISFQADKTDESLELLSIEQAKRQVVAGMNYELRLNIERNGQETTAMVIIWAKLDGSYQVTEWWWKG